MVRSQMESYISTHAGTWAKEASEVISPNIDLLGNMVSERIEAIDQASHLHRQVCIDEKECSQKERSEIIKTLKLKLELITSHAEQQARIFSIIEVSWIDIVYDFV